MGQKDVGEKVERSEREWREVLTPQQYEVMRAKGTEPPFTGRYVYSKDKGVFRCAACGAELFSSDAKFDSGTGWPSFTEPKVADAVELREDRSWGMQRTEAICRNCGGHLGHVFDDGPREAGGSAGASTPARWTSKAPSSRHLSAT